MCREDGLPVSIGECPIYLGVPLPVPTFYRSHYFEPVLAYCHYILDRVLHNRSCTTSASRQYVVSSIIQKKLTYSSTVMRCSENQYLALRSKIFQLVFDKALAAYDAAIALVLPGHLLDYKHAAIYTSLCSWERFFKSGGLPDFLRYWPPPCTLKGIGPLSLFAADINYLGWTFHSDVGVITDAAGLFTWKLGRIPKAELQHAIRHASRLALIRKLASHSSVWQLILTLMPLRGFIASGLATLADFCLKEPLLMLTALLIVFGKWASVPLLSALTARLRRPMFNTSCSIVPTSTNLGKTRRNSSRTVGNGPLVLDSVLFALTIFLLPYVSAGMNSRNGAPDFSLSGIKLKGMQCFRA